MAGENFTNLYPPLFCFRLVFSDQQTSLQSDQRRSVLTNDVYGVVLIHLPREHYVFYANHAALTKLQFQLFFIVIDFRQIVSSSCRQGDHSIRVLNIELKLDSIRCCCIMNSNYTQQTWKVKFALFTTDGFSASSLPISDILRKPKFAC